MNNKKGDNSNSNNSSNDNTIIVEVEKPKLTTWSSRRSSCKGQPMRIGPNDISIIEINE